MVSRELAIQMAVNRLRLHVTVEKRVGAPGYGLVLNINHEIQMAGPEHLPAPTVDDVLVYAQQVFAEACQIVSSDIECASFAAEFIALTTAIQTVLTGPGRVDTFRYPELVLA